MSDHSDFCAIPFDRGECELMSNCEQAMGTAITEVDVQFAGGECLTRISCRDGQMLLPSSHKDKPIEWIAFPMDQGVEVRTQGYAARSVRTSDTIELGTLMMTWLQRQYELSQKQ